jgi:hypothetical protein
MSLIVTYHTGLPFVEKDSLTKGMEQIIQHIGQWLLVLENKVIAATVDFAKLLL